MSVLIQAVSTLALVAIMAFCIFGFLATFEPPGFPVLRWLYAGCVAACLVAIGGVWSGGSTRRPA